MPSRPRIPAAIVLVYVALTLATAILGYRWGNKRFFSETAAGGKALQKQESIDSAAVLLRGAYRVQGRSMAPTLEDGQVCQVQPSQDNYKIGDVVAAEWDSIAHIKRVAAVEGDTVDVSEGRLKINGRRLEDVIAERQSKEVASSKFLPPGLAKLPARCVSWTECPDAPGWQVFRYRNPYQNGRVTQVVDDYPENVDVRRRLNPVDRLAIQVDSTQPLAVAFYLNQTTHRVTSGDGAVAASDVLRRSLATSESDVSTLEVPALSLTSQLAIKVDSPETLEGSVEVLRQIEYRDDHRPTLIAYPITLAKGELFLVGDNVPVSVDSRTIGPIRIEKVIGRVVSVDTSR